MPVVVSVRIVRAPLNHTPTEVSLVEASSSILAYIAAYRPVSRDLQGKLTQQITNCRGDLSCFGARLDQAGVALMLDLVADLGDELIVVTSRVIDSGGEVLFQGLYEAAGAEAAVQQETERAFAALGHPLAARLLVEVSPPDAKLTITPPPPVELEAGFAVAPGPVVVRAEASGFIASEARAEAIAGQDTRVTISLREASSVWASPWLWIAAGVVIAGGSAAAVVALSGTPEMGPRAFDVCQGQNAASCAAR